MPKPPPEPIYEQTTPSGVHLAYFNPSPRKRWYEVDGEKVPSVTEALGVLDKPALPWWGMKVGVEGVASLQQRDVDIPWGQPDAIVKMLTASRLTVNHVKQDAADRGTAVHDCLERLCEDVVPALADFPDEQRGFVQALCSWWSDHDPRMIFSELLVGSKERGYAGRFDLLYRDQAGRVVLADLKTSKGIFESFHLQLAAYQHAATECGYPTPDRTEVIRVAADGSYEVGVGQASPEQFFAVLAASKAMRSLKADLKAAA